MFAKTRTLSISHGPLFSLGMPPMTMGFRAGDAASLETLSAADKVRFQAEVREGEFVAKKIERLPR